MRGFLLLFLVSIVALVFVCYLSEPCQAACPGGKCPAALATEGGSSLVAGQPVRNVARIIAEVKPLRRVAKAAGKVLVWPIRAVRSRRCH